MKAPVADMWKAGAGRRAARLWPAKLLLSGGVLAEILSNDGGTRGKAANDSLVHVRGCGDIANREVAARGGS